MPRVLKENLRLKAAVFTALMVFAAIKPLHAQIYRTQLCPEDEPKVSIKVQTEDTKYIRSKNADILTADHNTGDGKTLGLAGGPIEIAIQSKFSISSRNKNACVKLDELDLSLTAKPEVHIASNFKKGSCEYNAILEHERQHIEIQRNFIREHTPKLSREVRRIVRRTETQKIVTDAHVKNAQKQIQQAIIEQISDYQARIFDILRYRQTQLDSPQEYEHVSKKCRNWNKRLSRNN